MLASLPMYDLPEVREATDAFWAALAKAYGVAGELTRAADWKQVWRRPDMLFSQTCGYPFTHEFRGRLTYVATPHYKADDCEGPLYCSLIFAREKSPLHTFRGRTAAFNSRDSMSGYLALKLALAPKLAVGKAECAFFTAGLETGSHAASLAAVQNGTADVCAIDCVTVALLRKYKPEAVQGLVEISRSPAVPGLPFVTRNGDVQRLQNALDHVMQDKALREVRSALLVEGMSILAPQDYDVILRAEKSIAHIPIL